MDNREQQTTPTKRQYTRRLSQKAVLEYLESVYPEWETFQQIVDNIPLLRVDCANLSAILTKLEGRGLIDSEVPGRGLFYYRLRKKERGGSIRNG